jgi:undecaprenyl-diphosphatase
MEQPPTRNATCSLSLALLAVVGLVSLAVFFTLGWLVAGESAQNALVNLDKAWAEHWWQYHERYPSHRYPFVVFTYLGSIPWMVAINAVGILWMFWQRKPVLAVGWLVLAVGGGLLTLGLKDFVERPRPPREWRDEAVTEDNESYPSGHSMGSMIGYGLFAYAGWCALQSRRSRLLLVASLGVLVLLIGFSRIYLRAHWFSDVVGGFAIGLAWLSLGLAVLGFYRRRTST